MNKYIVQYETGRYEDRYRHVYAFEAESPEEIKEKFTVAIETWKNLPHNEQWKPIVIEGLMYAQDDRDWLTVATNEIINDYMFISTLEVFFEESKAPKNLY